MSGRRNFFEKAVMEAHRDGSIATMVRARCTIGFNSEEERCYQAMKAISPKMGWPRGFAHVWTGEDQARHERFASDPFNQRTTWDGTGLIEGG